MAQLDPSLSVILDGRLIDRSDRVRIEVSGPDRAKFLHNLTTNEVKRLATGRGCEAFVTSLQGKTIGYVIILAAEDRILVRSDPGGMELALAHFGKYGMFDDVTIVDRSEATFELHLTGALNGFARTWEGEPPGEPGRIPARTEPRPPGSWEGEPGRMPARTEPGPPGTWEGEPPGEPGRIPARTEPRLPGTWEGEPGRMLARPEPGPPGSWEGEPGRMLARPEPGPPGTWEGEPPGEPGRMLARPAPGPPGITQGHLADEWVRGAGGRVPDDADYAHVLGELGGRPVRIVRESPAGMPGLSVIGEKGDLATVAAALTAAAGVDHLVELSPSEFEALRIEAGTPVFGKDVTEKNLPQELARDARAISFVKGCYLGQETVARIDALGHVNQVLKGLSFEPGSECPAPGSALEADGKRVGTITSAAFSPWRGHPVALGMIRTSHANAGTPLEVAMPGDAGPVVATVRDLPFPPRT